MDPQYHNKWTQNFHSKDLIASTYLFIYSFAAILSSTQSGQAVHSFSLGFRTDLYIQNLFESSWTHKCTQAYLNSKPNDTNRHWKYIKYIYLSIIKINKMMQGCSQSSIAACKKKSSPTEMIYWKLISAFCIHDRPENKRWNTVTSIEKYKSFQKRQINKCQKKKQQQQDNKNTTNNYILDPMWTYLNLLLNQ